MNKELCDKDMKQVVKSFLRNKKLCVKDLDLRVSESESERSLMELDNVVPYLLTAIKIIPEPHLIFTQQFYTNRTNIAQITKLLCGFVLHLYFG